MRTGNHYCSRCMCTRSFVDHGEHLDCPTCDKRLWRVAETPRAAPARLVRIGRPRGTVATARRRLPLVAALQG